MMRGAPRIASRNTFVSAWDAAAGSLHNSASDSIKSHPGFGHTALQFGMTGFVRRAKSLGLSPEQVETSLRECLAEYDKGQRMCESPIERSVLAALLMAPWDGFLSVPPKVHDGKNDESLNKGDIVIIPQFAFVRHRWDFAVVVEIGGAPRLIDVECDGDEFHNQPEAWRKDRGRTIYVESWSVPVFRLTGSEIHTDPAKAVASIVATANEWKANEPSS